MLWALNNQLTVCVFGFVVGSIVTWVVTSRYKSERTWKLVDLLWIICGGISALTALVASIYLSQSSAISRRIDLAQSELVATHLLASSFNARWCSANRQEIPPVLRTEFLSLCSSVDRIEQETRGAGPLFKFTDLLDVEKQDLEQDRIGSAWTSRDLSKAFEEIVGSPPTEVDRYDLTGWLFDFDIANKGQAKSVLSASGIYSGMANEYGKLEEAYAQLRNRFSELQELWGQVLARRNLILIRLASVLLLSLALPLRIGRSIHELRKQA